MSSGSAKIIDNVLQLVVRLPLEPQIINLKNKLNMETKTTLNHERRACGKTAVGNSTSTKELLECTVCWGSGKIGIDDFGNEVDCTWCNGTGIVSRNL